MTTAHLTDQEIQLFIAEPDILNSQLKKHVAYCQQCQASIANYRMMFEGIKQQEEPVFDFDVSALVINQLPVPKRSFSWMLLLIPILSIAVITVSAIFFSTAIITVVKGMSVILLAIAAASTIVILFFQALEMIKDYQKKMHLLSQKTLQL